MRVLIPARGSGRQRKAWGGAQRNPRLESENDCQPAERATVFVEIPGCRPLPQAVAFGPVVPGVSQRSTPGFTLSPTIAG